MWVEGFINASSFANLFWLFLGSFIGLFIGVLPALGANFGVALMLPFTFGMDPAAAIIFLCAIHASCNYGDSVTSILLNIPGGPGTVATCWDGYPMAQQGRGGEALGIATFGSFIGGVLVWILLALSVRPITDIALKFGAPEYFSLMLMALGLISVAAKGETIKGIIMVCFGLALSTIGQDPVARTTFRFSYGVLNLEAGIPITVSALGLFAISQVIVMFEEGGTVAKCVEVKDSLFKGFMAVIKRPLTILRAGAVGAFVGVLPALGVSLAGIASYLTEKKYSKEAGRFGQGVPDGVVAAEVGKGACVVGDLIPTFTLGVPGSVTGAILLAALIVVGVQPGPRFLLSGTLPYTIFVGLLMAQATFLITGLVLGRWMCRVAYIPVTILAPVLTSIVFLGAYAERDFFFDILMALFFGIFAYILEKVGYPVVCLILGLILGPIVEINLHRSLGTSLGSYSIFFTRPISLICLIITVIFLVGPYLLSLFHHYRGTSRGFLDKALEGGDAYRRYKGEMILLAFVSFIMVVFLITGRGYRPGISFFPNIACGLGLVFLLWRVLVILFHVFIRRESLSQPSPRPSLSLSLFGGSLSWPWAIVGMLGYILSIYLVGFVLATCFYVAAVTIMTMGRKSWLQAILTAVLTGLGIWLFAKTVSLLLPKGLLTGI